MAAGGGLQGSDEEHNPPGVSSAGSRLGHSGERRRRRWSSTLRMPAGANGLGGGQMVVHAPMARLWGSAPDVSCVCVGTRAAFVRVCLPGCVRERVGRWG